MISLVFFLTGFSSLIYQIVWQRILTLYYGVGSLSIALIVSTFLGGLGIGSLIGGFFAETIQQKSRLLAAIEIGIGIFGIASLALLEFLGTRTAGVNYLWALFCMAVFLIVPTTLMGMTLPILTKLFNHRLQNFWLAVSCLYFINTLGAALGALIASYILISFWGLDTAIYTAAAINFCLALFIYKVLANEESHLDQDQSFPQKEPTDILGNFAYLAVTLTGFLAVGYEIVWFRIIGVIIKESAYAFSTMLFVYLLAVACGSLWVGQYLHRRPQVDQKRLFFNLQFLIAVSVLTIFLVYYYLSSFIGLEKLTRLSFMIEPHPMITPLVKGLIKGGKSLMIAYYATVDVLFWPFLFMFIPAFFMGAGFPLIASLALKNKQVDGKTIGTVFFFNILGNVAGGLATGMFLLKYLGTERTLLIFIIIGLLFGLRKKWTVKLGVLRNMIVLCVIVISIFVFPKKNDLYAFIHPPLQPHFNRFIEEGINGVVVTQTGLPDVNTVYNFINGVPHGGRPGHQFFAQVLETVAYTPYLENVLVIGYGTGSTVEAILKLDSVKSVTLVEINQVLLTNLRKIEMFKEMLSDERLNIIIDDGRRFLQRAEKSYDAIFIDPLKTTSAYSNNLYSRQFLQLLKAHLNDQGAVLIWTSERDIVPKTIISVFEYVRFYLGGSNAYAIASKNKLHKDERRARNLLLKFNEFDRNGIVASGIPYRANEEQINEKTKNTPVNEDLKPRTEYYIGLLW
jgi:predicted membrane-bound spermidine synthase